MFLINNEALIIKPESIDSRELPASKDTVIAPYLAPFIAFSHFTEASSGAEDKLIIVPTDSVDMRRGGYDPITHRISVYHDGDNNARRGDLASPPQPDNSAYHKETTLDNGDIIDQLMVKLPGGRYSVISIRTNSSLELVHANFFHRDQEGEFEVDFDGTDTRTSRSSESIATFVAFDAAVEEIITHLDPAYLATYRQSQLASSPVEVAEDTVVQPHPVHRPRKSSGNHNHHSRRSPHRRSALFSAAMHSVTSITRH